MSDRFTTFRSVFNAFKRLPAEDLKSVYIMMGEYAMDGIEPEESESTAFVLFCAIKPLIDTSVKRSEAGRHGGKANSEQTEANNKQSESKVEAKKKDKREKEKEERIKESIGRFTPPSADEVREYARESGYHIDADGFIDFYASKGWMVGKNKMKDWRAAVRNWSRSDRQRQGGATKGNKFNFKGRDIDYDELERQLLQG